MNSQHGGMGQMSHGLTGSSQQIAAALFANSPLISDDLKLAAAAAAAAAAAQSARGKKMHRAEPVPQSGFKGVRCVLSFRPCCTITVRSVGTPA